MRIAERRWTHNRSEWGHTGRGDPPLPTHWLKEGRWHDEPDKVQWIDGDTRYACLAVRNHWGAWCGYVGVPETHPCYRRHYDEVDADVHGELTFADLCQESAPEGHGICHIPEPGHPDNVWWLGFDCGHFMDFQPRWPKLFDQAGWPERAQYRTLDYVQAECERLAAQLYLMDLVGI